MYEIIKDLIDNKYNYLINQYCNYAKCNGFNKVNDPVIRRGNCGQININCFIK